MKKTKLDSVLGQQEEKPKKWRKSISIGDYSKEVCVEEIENGFIVTLRESNYTSKLGYTEKIKKYFSTKNPLENVKESGVEEKVEDLKKVVDELDNLL